MDLSKYLVVLALVFFDGGESGGHEDQHIPHNPHVHGIVHTVKQVKVFDSLPGTIQVNTGDSGSHGYEVTEEGEGDEDAFNSINTIPQSYPATYDFVRSAAPQHTDSYAGIALQSTVQSSHDPFAAGPQPTDFSALENFSSDGQSDAFAVSLPEQGVLSNAHAPPEFASGHVNPESVSGYDDPENTFVGNDISDIAFISTAEANDDTPVSFSREAGIQQTVKTGGIETIEY
ncbi:unnamed protein product [Parnassius mnemosyne]|uniref:Uncharacterized protein n=1 Tax=Parnassius mnemosyne TaxID=213953 RepID=A0AAV1L037_9NEOP